MSYFLKQMCFSLKQAETSANGVIQIILIQKLNKIVLCLISRYFWLIDLFIYFDRKHNILSHLLVQ